MLKLGYRRRDIEGHCNAAGAPDPMHRGDVVDTRRHKKRDALFFEISFSAYVPV